MTTPWKTLAFGLCAMAAAGGCAASGSNLLPPPPEDAAADKAPADAGPDLDAPPLDAEPDAGADAQPDAASDVAGDAADAEPDAGPDVAADVAPDAAPDVAPDAACRTRCGGFCSDPDTDVHNCGGCGNDCTLRPGVDMSRVRCMAGRCDFTGACLAGRANCSGNPDDGCEAMVTTAARCGSCVTSCADPTPNCGAMPGAPGGYACTSGCIAPTPMRCGTQCVDTMTDARNCGACGTVCPTGSFGTPACAGGRCTLTCNAGYGDCDGVPSNGCETRTLTNVMHCGACGNACPPGPGASAVCSAGACTITCSVGSGNCDMNAANGCETDTRTNVAHCGACGNACPARPNAASTCAGGACGVTCAAGYGNCNAVVTDGCEAQLAADPLNCGACARRCATAANATPACRDGACGLTCLTNYGNCDGNGLNGCESALSTDPANCGACGTRCPSAPGASAACSAGRCTLACMTGQADCDMSPSNGCEVDTTTSIAHCGGCGRACNAPSNGRASCAAGRCVVTCDDGFALSGDLCVRAPPRPVAPAGGDIVTSRRPVFRVALPAGQTGARVEVCGDRACTSVATTLTFAGASATSTATLAPGVYYWRVSGSISGSVVTAASPVTEFVVMAGSATPVSASWGPVLDANGDRYVDLLVGAPASNRAYFWTNSSGFFSTSTAAYRLLTGTTSHGTAVAAAGDVNGDGYGDALIGAPSANQAQVYHGSTSGLVSATTTLTAPAGVTRFGASVACAGDVNGDGYHDVVVGAPGSNRAYLYYGRAAGVDGAAPVTLLPTGGSANFGVSVAGVGDVNADGYGDLAVGTDGAEIVYVWYGGPSGLRPTPTGLGAPSGAAGFGRAVAGAGDVNGDGYPDVVVGAYNASTAYVFFGAASNLSSSPGATLAGVGAQFGLAVDGAGDVNGDGYGDVAVGAPGADRTHVFLGRAGGVATAASQTLTPTYAGYQFGAAVSGVGDFNLDGYADLVASSPSRVAQLFRGGAAGVTLNTTLFGGSSVSIITSTFGQSIALGPRRVPRS